MLLPVLSVHSYPPALYSSEWCNHKLTSQLLMTNGNDWELLATKQELEYGCSGWHTYN